VRGGAAGAGSSETGKKPPLWDLLCRKTWAEKSTGRIGGPLFCSNAPDYVPVDLDWYAVALKLRSAEEVRKDMVLDGVILVVVEAFTAGARSAAVWAEEEMV